MILRFYPTPMSFINLLNCIALSLIDESKFNFILIASGVAEMPIQPAHLMTNSHGIY